MKLSILEYMRYLDGSTTSKCVVEGENVINAGHLILAGKSEVNSDSIYLYGLCLQSSSLDSNPHEITGKISISSGIKIDSMLCSCKAGNSGRCKHVSALLIKCIREDVESLEYVSKTDKKCIWSTQKFVTKDKYKPVPVDEIPCFQNKIKKVSVSVDGDDVRNSFFNLLPDSAIGMHRLGRRNVEEVDVHEIDQINDTTSYKYHLTEILRNSYESIIMMYLASVSIILQKDCCAQVLANLCSDDIEACLNIPQHSAEWKKMRKYRITGSRCYEIYTYSKSDWKTKALRYFCPVPFTNKYVKHGIQYESTAREIFVTISQMNVVECGFVISAANEWLGYSPDGVIFDGDKPLYLLEIKCVFEGKTKTVLDTIPNIKYIFQENGEYKLKKKHKYYAQIQMGMAILNLSKTYFVIYASYDDSVLIMEIEFDFDFTLNMLTTVKNNYFQKMLHFCCEQ